MPRRRIKQTEESCIGSMSSSHDLHMIGAKSVVPATNLFHH